MFICWSSVTAVPNSEGRQRGGIQRKGGVLCFLFSLRALLLLIFVILFANTVQASELARKTPIGQLRMLGVCGVWLLSSARKACCGLSEGFVRDCSRVLFQATKCEYRSPFLLEILSLYLQTIFTFSRKVPFEIYVKLPVK